MPIDRIRRVPLREVWPHEAHNFTTWLEQNLDLLDDDLGGTLVDFLDRAIAQGCGLGGGGLHRAMLVLGVGGQA